MPFFSLTFAVAPTIYSVLGSILIVIGLYSVLWGKHKERQEEQRLLREIPEVVKGNETTGKATEEIEATKLSSAAVIITIPIPESSPQKASQMDKE